MTEIKDQLCPAVQLRAEDAQCATPVPALTHAEQIAEYVRIVEEARMRT